MFAKMYPYYSHSTNHNNSFDQQNVIILQLNLKMNGMPSKRSKATQNDLVSEKERIKSKVVDALD